MMLLIVSFIGLFVVAMFLPLINVMWWLSG